MPTYGTVHGSDQLHCSCCREQGRRQAAVHDLEEVEGTLCSASRGSRSHWAMPSLPGWSLLLQAAKWDGSAPGAIDCNSPRSRI